MYEINLEGSFESSKLKFRRRDRLSEIVVEAEKNMRARFRASSFYDKDVTSSLISDFCAVYFSLDSRLSKMGLFSDTGKDQFRLNKIYSLYMASVAITNRLFDDNIEAILQAQESPKYFYGISEKDFEQITDHGLLGTLVEKVKSLPRGNSPENEKYHLYLFFDTIRAYARNTIATSCSKSTLQSLNNIRVVLKDMDFRDLSAGRRVKKNGSQKAKPQDDKAVKEELEKLPDTLPAYVQIFPDARLDRVVGNVEGLKTLLSSLHQAIEYDPVGKTNPWCGLGYYERILLHGTQGTGKNFTIDAVLNAGKQIARKYGVSVEYVNFKKELRSIYKDRVPQLLAHFAGLELNSNKVYVNVLNEADGLFGVCDNGSSSTEVNKLISDAKEIMDAAMGKGIVWWLVTNNPSVFEAAMGDRLISVAMNGAVSPEEHYKLFEFKLEKAKEAGKYKLTPDELTRAVDYFMQRKQELLGDYGIIVSGRGVADICERFTSFDMDSFLKNSHAVHSASRGDKRKVIYGLMPEVTFKRLMAGIDSYLNSLEEKKLCNEAYARQHGR